MLSGTPVGARYLIPLENKINPLANVAVSTLSNIVTDVHPLASNESRIPLNNVATGKYVALFTVYDIPISAPAALSTLITYIPAGLFNPRFGAIVVVVVVVVGPDIVVVDVDVDGQTQANAPVA